MDMEVMMGLTLNVPEPTLSSSLGEGMGLFRLTHLKNYLFTFVFYFQYAGFVRSWKTWKSPGNLLFSCVHLHGIYTVCTPRFHKMFGHANLV